MKSKKIPGVILFIIFAGIVIIFLQKITPFLFVKPKNLVTVDDQALKKLTKHKIENLKPVPDKIEKFSQDFKFQLTNTNHTILPASITIQQSFVLSKSSQLTLSKC